MAYGYLGFPWWLPGGSLAFPGKVSAYNAGEPGSILGRKDPLENEMATHSNTPAWKIPWMEEHGRLQSIVSQESDMTERLHFHFNGYISAPSPFVENIILISFNSF